VAKRFPRSPLTRCVAVVGLAAILAACATEPKHTLRVMPGVANGQSLSVHSSLPVKVYIIDNNGAGISGAVVTWSVINHAGATAAATSTTDTTGAATVTWTLDTIARIDSLTASSPSATSATITATGLPGQASAFTKISGDNQGTAVTPGPNTIPPDPLVVAVTDRYGNGVSGAPVAWASACNFVFNGGAPTDTYAGAPTDASGKSRVYLFFASPRGTCAIQASTTAVSTVLVFHMQGF
jgi:hypothetical protein